MASASSTFMWPGRRPATGWIAKRTFGAPLPEQLRDLVERILRLRDGHAVAGDDDDLLRVEQELGGLGGRDALHLAGRLRSAGRRRAFLGAEAAEDDAQERAVHRRAHDVAQDGAARSDQRAGDDEQVVGEHEAGGRRRPARVAVEHRHDDRHVGAADRHHEVDADDAGEHRAEDQRHRRRVTARPRRRRTACARYDAGQDHRDVERVPARQQQRLAAG